MPYENNNKYAETLYKKWESTGAFKAEPDSGKPRFALMIPPPNVTGNLHMGHAFTMLRQDMTARYQRMKGKDVLWLPGTDHASIAVQMMVEKDLAKDGMTRKDLGRVGFIARAWEWKNTYAGNIQRQLRRLGCSLDWSREAFTMNPDFSRAVEHAFIKMYDDGLIYKDTRLVNWDPVMLTSVSDLEVISVEEQGTMYYIRYDVEGVPDGITIATVRPETKLGDGAIAVNPNDERYKHLIGKFAILPFAERRLPIVVDEHADKAKGTGAVKITPAHDFNDFEVGKRHNIKPINIFTPDAKIDISEIENPNDFIRSLAGKDRFEARELMVDKLRETGHLVKSEPCLHNVPHAERGGAVLEPRLTSQWYCDVKKLAEIAVEKARTSELKFIPDLWKNTWYSWLENVQPWCISRQLWWGHRIPAYYDEKGNLAYVGTTPPEGLVRDDDVLDTWFSSGLWPMATLGWPDVYAKDFRAYYPNSVIITGFDIIFFWVARMVMFGLYFTDKLPFDKVVLHGLVTDEKGLKMSKTKGNVIDPITIIDQYGIDAVRFAVCAAANQNRTNPFGHQNVEASHKFITKLMNAAEFWIRNGISAAPRFRPEDSNPLADWILSRMNAAIANADRAMEEYRYDEYANNIYHFVWDDFCSSFIELAKREMTPATIAAAEVAMKGILRMLQPVVPFITAELWARMGFGDAVKFMREKFAEPVKLKCSPEEIETWWQTKQADKLALEDEAKNKAELTQVKGRIVSLERQLADTVFTSRAKSEIVAERRASLKSAYARRDVLEKLLKRSAD